MDSPRIWGSSVPFLTPTLPSKKHRVTERGKKWREKKPQPCLETLTSIFNFAAPEIPARRKFWVSLWFVLFSRFQLHQQLYQCKSNYASCLLIPRALTLAAEAYLGVSGASAFLRDRTGTPQKPLGVGEGVCIRESSAGSAPQQRGCIAQLCCLLGAVQGSRSPRCPGVWRLPFPCGLAPWKPGLGFWLTHLQGGGSGGPARSGDGVVARGAGTISRCP